MIQVATVVRHRSTEMKAFYSVHRIRHTQAGINHHTVRRTLWVPVSYSYGRDYKEEAPHSSLKNLITKLNAEIPHMFRAMIVWIGGKEPVIGTYRRCTCPLVDMMRALP
ncbi:hypothetical protein V6N11_004092 [Hibiscus sabdariffa]|uniref:Uncharacterized protein n=1 Tax=Hibiscus sabdariffa TaxID=183260 RepID=A0ABR2SF77_9ROSI